MSTKEVIAKAMEAVIFLFAGFGYFLSNIAPPENERAPFAVGFASFLTLIVLLLISALVTRRSRKQYRKAWITVAIVFFILTPIIGFVYQYSLISLTFGFPPESPHTTFYAGFEMLPGAAKRKADRHLSNAQLLDEYGGYQYINNIWPEKSRSQATLLILGEYVALVLSIATALFCLTEAFFAGTNKRRDRAPVKA